MFTPLKTLSLASRLTLWYAGVVLLLLTSFAFVQYRLLSGDLASEDDELLLQTLGAASRGAIPREAISSSGSLLGPHVRVLDRGCRLIVGRIDPQRPPIICPGPEDAAPMFRTWTAPNGRTWRSISMRLSGDSQVPALPRNALWVEATLDRWTDFSVLESYRHKLLAMVPVAILLSGIIGYLIARRGLSPLTSISKTLSQVDADSLSQKFEIHERIGELPAEIVRLLTSLDEMRQKLRIRFDVLEKLSAELAHEFRTPVHVLRQQAEIALTQSRTTSEYKDVLAYSLEEYERLNRMIGDTLFLARVEDPAAHVTLSHLNVREELVAVTGFFEALAAEKEIGMTLDAPIAISINADRTLFRRALVNVLANAITHTPAEGSVKISAIENESTASIDVSDSGPGIAEGDLPRVFDRYFRGRHHSGREGTGLGLSIVKGIMALHRGSVQITNADPHGTVVSLTFPKNPQILTKL